MGQERLSNLAIMSIEREMLASFDHREVIDRFAKLKARHFHLQRTKQREYRCGGREKMQVNDRGREKRIRK